MRAELTERLGRRRRRRFVVVGVARRRRRRRRRAAIASTVQCAPHAPSAIDARGSRAALAAASAAASASSAVRSAGGEPKAGADIPGIASGDSSKTAGRLRHSAHSGSCATAARHAWHALAPQQRAGRQLQQDVQPRLVRQRGERVRVRVVVGLGVMVVLG